MWYTISRYLQNVTVLTHKIRNLESLEKISDRKYKNKP